MPLHIIGQSFDRAVFAELPVDEAGPLDALPMPPYGLA
jgi:hypothetical protein